MVATPLLTYFHEKWPMSRVKKEKIERTPEDSGAVALTLPAFWPSGFRPLSVSPLERGNRLVEAFANPSKSQTSPPSTRCRCRVGSAHVVILLIVVLGVVAYRYRVKILARVLGQPERRIERQIGRKKNH